ncbi:MAG: acyltransferase [Chryseobacterium sp.]
MVEEENMVEEKNNITTKQHYNFLDALRGIAILGVILVHSGLSCGLTGISLSLCFAGQRGVQLFYVVSAFALLYSFDVRSKNEKYPIKNYFIRRYFRIAPLFYIAVIGNLLIHGFSSWHDAPNGLNWLKIMAGLLFLNGWHPDTINAIAMGGWSIADEFSFYLILPVILSWIKTARTALIFLIFSAVLAIIFSASCASLLNHVEYFSFLWFPIQFPVFCMGILAYYIVKESKDCFLKSKHIKIYSLLLAVCSAIIFLTSFPTRNDTLYWSSFAFVPLIIGLSIHEWKFFVNRVSIFLGKISFSIYLVHFFFLLGISRSAEGYLMFFGEGGGLMIKPGTFYALTVTYICVFLPTVIVSIFTHKFIETKGINLGRNLIERWEKTKMSARI